MVTRVGENNPGEVGRAESWETEKLSLQLEREATRRRYQAQTDGSANLQDSREPDSPSSDLEREDQMRRFGASGARLRQIDEALHRIRTGRYGLCTSCGIRIGRARLDLDLATEYCLVCQSESERDSPHHNH